MPRIRPFRFCAAVVALAFVGLTAVSTPIAHPYDRAGTVADTHIAALPTWEGAPDPLTFSVQTLGYLRQLAPNVGMQATNVRYVALTAGESYDCDGQTHGPNADMSAFGFCLAHNTAVFNLESMQQLWLSSHDSLRMTTLLMRTYGFTTVSRNGRCAIGALLHALVKAGQVTADQALAQINRYDQARRPMLLRGYSDGC